MKKSALIFLILGLASGCKNSFSVRMTADYFPLTVGNTWLFDVKGNNDYRLEMRVTGTQVSQGDSLITVEAGGEIYFFQRKAGVVNKVREVYTTYEGEKVVFGTLYELYLLLPPLEGENWEREFNFSSFHNGENLEKSFFISVDSVTQTSIILNSKNYENVYRIKRTIVEDNDSTVEYEWFAPDVGLIKKEVPADSLIWELVSYQLNE
ncbi:MAG: hypothetical protein P8Z50_06610 [candidate division WOR-3 bacterium]|jgi:hypothetical protein